jgi:hypothetical protein
MRIAPLGAWLLLLLLAHGARPADAAAMSAVPSEPGTAAATTAAHEARKEKEQLDPTTRTGRELSAFSVDTTNAPISVGNPSTGCTVSNPSDGSSFTYTSCINQCRSIFYEVTGTGSTITASSCGATNSVLFYQQFYVWKGNTCADFACVSTYRSFGLQEVAWHRRCASSARRAHRLTYFSIFHPPTQPTTTCAAAKNFNCPGDDSGNTIVTWASELGVTYYVQVTGVQSNFAGTTTLTFTGSAIDPAVTEVSGTRVRSDMRERDASSTDLNGARIYEGARTQASIESHARFRAVPTHRVLRGSHQNSDEIADETADQTADKGADKIPDETSYQRPDKVAHCYAYRRPDEVPDPIAHRDADRRPDAAPDRRVPDRDHLLGVRPRHPQTDPTIGQQHRYVRRPSLQYRSPALPQQC